MEITKERLEERIADLEHQKEQAIANINAVEGALQDCRFWLEQLVAAEGSETK